MKLVQGTLAGVTDISSKELPLGAGLTLKRVFTFSDFGFGTIDDDRLIRLRAPYELSPISAALNS